MAMALPVIVAANRQRQMPSIVRQQAFANLQMPELPTQAPKRLVAKTAGKLPFASDHRSPTPLLRDRVAHREDPAQSTPIPPLDSHVLSLRTLAGGDARYSRRAKSVPRPMRHA